MIEERILCTINKIFYNSSFFLGISLELYKYILELELLLQIFSLISGGNGDLIKYINFGEVPPLLESGEDFCYVSEELQLVFMGCG